jgi:formylmethanofuran dehydrogenase subunit D
MRRSKIKRFELKLIIKRMKLNGGEMISLYDLISGNKSDKEYQRMAMLAKLSYKELQKLNKAERTAVMRWKSKQGKKKEK